MGFSNGGEFAARAALEMSNELVKLLPLLEEGVLCLETLQSSQVKETTCNVNIWQSGWKNIESFRSSYKYFLYLWDLIPCILNIPFYIKFKSILMFGVFELNDKSYQVLGDTNSVVYANYYGVSGMAANTFRIVNKKSTSRISQWN